MNTDCKSSKTRRFLMEVKKLDEHSHIRLNAPASQWAQSVASSDLFPDTRPPTAVARLSWKWLSGSSAA